ncbi:MAG: MMPL family transporter [Limosilactobacillus pontis]
MKGTALRHGTVVVGGQSSKITDTKRVAGGDFIRTAAIMVIGIGLALILITRSLLQPVYILGTLVSAYMAALSITHLLTRVFLGRPLLTWNTPFFSFIMLLALGVDYSIFLVMPLSQH